MIMSCKAKTLLLLSGCAGLVVSSQAQTNYTTLPPAMTKPLVLPRPVVTRVGTNANPALATVEFTLPQGASLKNYSVLENRANVTRAASDVTAKSGNAISASLAPGSTLMLMENEPGRSLKAASALERRQLFSTHFVKALAPARLGDRPRTVFGTLTLVADAVPTLWNVASNAYVAHLTVMFLTDPAATSSPLLPMAVQLSGQHTRSIEPQRIKLETPNVDGGKEVVVTCDQYAKAVQITAYYSTTNSTVPLELQPLTLWSMIQMVISAPLLFAALAGGLMGGLLRLFKGTTWGWLRTLRYLAEGATVGLVTVTLLLAGLLHSQVAQLQSQSQLVLAFALAAAAGSVGAHFLDKIVDQLRGKWFTHQRKEDKA
jgi:hypothetical protein